GAACSRCGCTPTPPGWSACAILRDARVRPPRSRACVEAPRRAPSRPACHATPFPTRLRRRPPPAPYSLRRQPAAAPFRGWCPIRAQSARAPWAALPAAQLGSCHLLHRAEIDLLLARQDLVEIENHDDAVPQMTHAGEKRSGRSAGESEFGW